MNWLDLNLTTGQTYNDALANNPEWRAATNSEVENLFRVLFDGYVDTRPEHWSDSRDVGAYASMASDAEYFRSLFGNTFETGGDNYQSYGLYEDEDGILRLLGVLQDLQSDPNYTRVFSDEFTNNYETYRDLAVSSNGVFMVQTSVVPIPAAIWLFGSGLIGLFGLARREKI